MKLDPLSADNASSAASVLFGNHLGSHNIEISRDRI
jgi:hypothetical protein